MFWSTGHPKGIREEGQEPPNGGRSSRQPNLDSNKLRHERSNLRREHRSEQRGKSPNGSTYLAPTLPICTASIYLPELVEEEDDRAIGAGDERHRGRVVVRLIDGESGVACQHTQAEFGQQRGTIVKIHVYSIYPGFKLCFFSLRRVQGVSCGSLLMYDSTFMCSSFLAKSIWKNLSIDVTRYSESLAGPPPAGPNKATVGGLDAPATDRSRLIIITRAEHKLY